MEGLGGGGEASPLHPQVDETLVRDSSATTVVLEELSS